MKIKTVSAVVTGVLLAALSAAFLIPLGRGPIVYFDDLRLGNESLLTLTTSERYRFVPHVQYLPPDASLSILLSVKEPIALAPEWAKSDDLNLPGYVEYNALPNGITRFATAGGSVEGMEFPPFALPLKKNFASRVYFSVRSGKKPLTEGLLVVACGDTHNSFVTGERARKLIGQIGSERKKPPFDLTPRAWDK